MFEEYVTRTKRVIARQITEKPERISKQCWGLNGVTVDTTRQPVPGDYLVQVGDSQFYVVRKAEFEATYRLNTKDNWEFEQLEGDHDFSWALSNMKAGMKVRLGDGDPCWLDLKDGRFYSSNGGVVYDWFISHDEIKSTGWQVVMEES